MNLEENNFKFDETVAPVFDKHVSQSVPMYKEFHSMITDIGAWFIADETNVYDVGTSTGTLLLKLKERYNKNVKYIGIDKSIDMIDFTKKKNYGIELVCGDVTEGFSFENASFISSVLTLQFIRQDLRQKVINNIYNGLNSGGVFIFVEKVTGNNVLFNEIWTDLLYENKLKNGLDEKHIIEKSKSIRGVMKPVSVAKNISMLENAGFSNIDIFMKWGNFAGFIAVKE